MRMLAAPVLLDEVLGSIGSHQYKIKLEILKTMTNRAVLSRKEWENVNSVLDQWFSESPELLDQLSLQDLEMLFDALKEGIFCFFLV